MRRPQIDPTSTPDQPQIDPKSTPNRSQTDPKSTPDQQHIDPKPTPNRAHIERKSSADRPQTDSKLIPKRPQIDPKSIPNRPQIDPNRSQPRCATTSKYRRHVFGSVDAVDLPLRPQFPLGILNDAHLSSSGMSARVCRSLLVGCSSSGSVMGSFPLESRSGLTMWRHTRLHSCSCRA